MSAAQKAVQNPFATEEAAGRYAAGRPAERQMLPMQPGDVPATWADTTLLRALSGYAPQTEVRDGVRQYVDWFRDYYRVGNG